MQELSPHAIYMRLKRYCGRTQAGKLQVPAEVHDQWVNGSREELSLALIKALKLHGTDSSHSTRKLVRVGVVSSIFFPTEIERIQICSSEKLQICSSESFSLLMHALQAEFQEQLVKIKEHTRQKDEEIEGGWYTEERLEKDLGWSKSFGPFFSPCFFFFAVLRLLCIWHGVW